MTITPLSVRYDRAFDQSHKAGLEWRRPAFPWAPEGTLISKGLRTRLEASLDRASAALLPFRMEILAPPVEELLLNQFVSAIGAQIGRDCRTILGRLEKLSDFGMPLSEALSAVRQMRRCQPWIIIYDNRGGLEWAKADGDGGVVVCSSRINHGVAWWYGPGDRIRHALVTARQEGRDWDWDGDIGHEFTHAALAPVPLYTQGMESAARRVRLDSVSPDGLSPNQVARIVYATTEVLVTSLRAEQRFTPTGLPEFTSAQEFHGFLALLDQICPDLGFGRACAQLQHVDSFCVGDDFSIAPAIPPLLRFAVRTRGLVGRSDAPCIQEVSRARTTLAA